MAIGYDRDVERYDIDANEWSVYFNMSTSSWVTAGCLAQTNGKLYKVFSNIEALDPVTLEVEILGQVPDSLRNPGKCSSLTLNGVPGKARFSQFAFLLLHFHYPQAFSSLLATGWI